LNRVILEILSHLSRLEGEGNTEAEEIAIHASAIQNAFFDKRKQLEDVIPPVLLVITDERVEIPPRKVSQIVAEPKIKKVPKKKQKKVAAANS
jgi:hypothetical protein